MESPYLFSLSEERSPEARSTKEYYVYIGLNRVVAGREDRVGSGLCKVEISLYELGQCRVRVSVDLTGLVGWCISLLLVLSDGVCPLLAGLV